MLKDDLMEKLTGPFTLPEMDPRAMENPISALFDLAEQVSEKAFYMRKNIYYTVLFLVFSLGVWLIILIQQIVHVNPVGMIIFFLILISGLFTVRILYFDLQFFEFFSRRFNAIRLVREGNPNLYVPGGDTPVERYLNYQKENLPEFGKLLTEHPESIQFSAIIRGQSGGAYQFDAYIGISGGSEILKKTNLPRMVKGQGYALFIKVFDMVPTMAEIKALEDTVHDITAATCLPPRVVGLVEAGDGELPDDVYHHITEKSAIAMCRKGNYPYNVQLITSIEGSYDFIPLISSEGLP